jgi:single-stranded DNA-binding protein
MKFLNSVLIEGVIIGEPDVCIDANFARCSFSINSGEDAHSIPIVAYGAIVRKSRKALHKGRAVRIVGKLKSETDKRSQPNMESLYIVAEHMEFRPQFPKEAPHG